MGQGMFIILSARGVDSKVHGVICLILKLCCS